MRALLFIVLIVAALWGGYWFVGARSTEQSVEGWFASQSGTGLRAEQSGVVVKGFPNRFDLTITEPRLFDEQSGAGWSAPFAQVFAMTWKPWHLIATLPQEQTLTLPTEELRVSSTLFQGGLVLVPNTDLALDRTIVIADGLALQSTAGWEVSATSARFATRRTPDQAMAHEIGLELATFTPDAAFRMALQQQSDLPEQIEQIRLDIRADFDAPIDRHFSQTQPRLRGVVAKELLLRWGDLVISGKGEVVPQTDGYAEGRVEFRVENWRKLVPVLVAAGLITPQVSDTVTRALQLLAEQDGTADVLDIPLVFQQGRMSLGPIPLGPAPMLR